MSDEKIPNNDPIYGVGQTRVSVGIGDTGHSCLYDVEPDVGARESELLRFAERDLRKVGMNCTMLSLSGHVEDVVLAQERVEAAFFDRYQDLKRALDAVRDKNNDEESAEEDEILDAMEVAWFELTDDQRGELDALGATIAALARERVLDLMEKLDIGSGAKLKELVGRKLGAWEFREFDIRGQQGTITCRHAETGEVKLVSHPQSVWRERGVRALIEEATQ